jgi:hypothetical protein
MSVQFLGAKSMIKFNKTYISAKNPFPIHIKRKPAKKLTGFPYITVLKNA